MTLKDKLFSFEGRLRRRDWWFLSIAIAVLSMGLSQLVTRALFHDLNWLALDAPYPVQATLTLSYLPFWWPQMALAVKRAHDRAQSGRLMAILYGLTFAIGFIPYDWIGPGMVPTSLMQAIIITVVNLINVGGGVYVLVVLGILDGTPGANRFGPAPK